MHIGYAAQRKVSPTVDTLIGGLWITASFVLCLAPVITAKWICRSLLGLACVVAQLHGESGRVVTSPAGKLYHGFYWGGVGTDEHDPTEHDVTPEDVARYEQAVGK